MTRDNDTQSGGGSHAQRVHAARVAGGGYVGEVSLGGVPADVVYVGAPPSEAVQPTPFFVGPQGEVHWQDGAVRGGNAAPSNAPRALVRRPGPLARAVPSMIDARPASTPVGRAAGGEGGGDLQKIHRLLRGKYWLAILLAAVLGAAGGYAGVRLGYKTFQSTGLVAITPIQMFNAREDAHSTEQFMQAEVAKFKSQRVVDAALDDPAWRRLGRTRSDAVEAAFLKELSVSSQGNTLLVTFVDRDPEAAAVAVQATMNAFKRLFNAEQAQSGSFTQDQWMEARNNLNANLTTTQEKIDDLAGIYGPDGLAMIRDIKVKELQDVEKGINDLDVLQAQLLANPQQKVATEATIEDIAKLDPLLASLNTRRAQCEEDIAQLRANGMLDKNPRLLSAQAMLKVLENEIATRAADWRASHPQLAHMGAAGDTLTPLTLQTMTPESVRARSAYLKSRKTTLEGELRTLSTQLGGIATLRIDKDRIEHDLNTAEEELQQYNIQKLNYRIDVNDADRPLGAFRDTRITFAGAGGAGGVALGFGIVLLIGLSDRRVKDSRDAAGKYPGTPILGMLPQLPKDMADPEQAAVAAHGVHEIRTLLQIAGREAGHQIFGVTSADAGTGKTSLTLALGVSFASAGVNTLLIDCDIIGGGLTRRIDAIVRRKIGEILKRDGYITEEQLNAALGLARGSGRKLGEILIELGHLSKEDLGSAILAQAEESVGLLDALSGTDLEECIAETGISGLSVLPLGSASPEHAGAISPDALERVLDAARQRFDVVLVDTGPMPGSLEASVVASEVDSMLVTVARGDRGSDVQRSIEHLRSVRARLAGLVFNRASTVDIDRYGSSRMSSGSKTSANRRMAELPGSDRFGPVAQAVAQFVPSGGRCSTRTGN